jgi:hypothetical protein
MSRRSIQSIGYEDRHYDLIALQDISSLISTPRLF